MSVYSSKQRKQRSITRFAFKLSVGLLLITAVIIVLAVVISRVLPSAGAVGFIAYYDGNADIYGQDIARGTLVNLTNNDSANDNEAFSPDGRQMIFTSSTNGGFSQIYLQAVKCDDLFATCGSVKQLTYTTKSLDSISWSPNGSQIAYLNGDDIYVLNIISGLDHNITQNPAPDFAPVWSPDGSQIAFSSQRDISAAEIYVANSDGSHLQRLTHNDVWDYPPIWSPDGTRMAFMSHHHNGYDLQVMDIRDGSIRNLTPNPLANVISPIWSPDGSQIEFWDGNGQTSFLYAVDLLHDETPKRIVSLTGAANQYFTRLPDGRFLFLHGTNELQASDLYVLDGDQMRLLAYNAYPPIWWP